MAKEIFKAIDWYIHAAFIVAICLGIAGFIVPPTGSIDPSVITFVAELVGGAALITFLEKLPEYIRKGASASITHGNTSVTISGKDGRKGRSVEVDVKSDEATECE